MRTSSIKKDIHFKLEVTLNKAIIGESDMETVRFWALSPAQVFSSLPCNLNLSLIPDLLLNLATPPLAWWFLALDYYAWGLVTTKMSEFFNKFCCKICSLTLKIL
jgi:hypothetical protein